MWFDIPVFAYRSSAVPETLGSGGILFNAKENLREVAAAAHLLCSRDNLRSTVIKQQRDRRKFYLPERVEPILETLADTLMRGAGPTISWSGRLTLAASS